MALKLKEGLIGAGSGALTGAASGTPHGVAIGAVTGLVSGIFGGGGDDGAASELYDKKHQRNLNIYRFNNKEGLRKQNYEEQSLSIRKRNDEDNLLFQELVSQNNYDHGMSIRQFQFDQERRAYEASVDAATEQIGFNQMAANFAGMQQDRAHSEQLISLMFDEQQTLLDYNVQATGLAENRDRTNLKEARLTGAAQRDAQAQRLEGMKSAGTARNVGSGRSSAKAMQAAIAEAGANQAAIADELMFGLTDIDLDLASINNKMESMSNQLILDQTMLMATRDNINARDVSVRNQIGLNTLNANRQAFASIRMKPEINPPLPEPIALPRPQYQEVYQYKAGPKPKRIDAKTGAGVSQGSSASSWVPQLVQGIQTFATAAINSSGGGYTGGNAMGAGSNIGANDIGATYGNSPINYISQPTFTA